MQPSGSRKSSKSYPGPPNLDPYLNRSERLQHKVTEHKKRNPEPTKGEYFLASKGHKRSQAKVKLYENFHLKMEKYRQRTEAIRQGISEEMKLADVAKEY